MAAEAPRWAGNGPAPPGSGVAGCPTEEDLDDWDGLLPRECQAGGAGGKARVNLDPLPLGGTLMGHAARNSVVQSEKKNSAARNIGLTRDSRATVEMVLDARTRQVLSSFLNRGIFKSIHGSITTGKESNVYYATAPGGAELAVKIYKTSIKIFKDRGRYVEGDVRFRHGYFKSNPRKMVPQWAEKEMRNLKRLQACGINAPKAIEVQKNVLVLEFIGHDGEAAPPLKAVQGLEEAEWLSLYEECALAMRRMMQRCRLVHGDLSEYNMLYDRGSLVILDVSQSVESDHPQALDLLKRDCVNVNGFFGRRAGRPTIPVKRLFDYVVTRVLPRAGGAAWGPNEDREALKELLADTADGSEDGDGAEDEVFVQTWVPSSLSQVEDRAFIERELDRLERGEEVLYERLLAGQPVGGAEADGAQPEAAQGETERAAGAAEAAVAAPAAEADGEGSSAGSGDKGERDGQDDGRRDGHRPDGMERAEWKALVKEERRRSREDKIPKATKKKYERQAAQGR